MFGQDSAKLDNWALVVGNGESRRDVDLSQFKKNHIIVGCNALHRDIVVDHLICCDRRMVDESLENPSTKNTIIYTRHDWFRFYRKVKKNKNVMLLPELPYTGNEKVDHPDHWGSGPYALLVAALLGVKEIRLVGFDLYPTVEKVNNLYKGTENYSLANSKPVDYSYWVYQINKIFYHFPNIQFVIYNKPDWEFPEYWTKNNVRFENLDSITVDL